MRDWRVQPSGLQRPALGQERLERAVRASRRARPCRTGGRPATRPVREPRQLVGTLAGMANQELADLVIVGRWVDPAVADQDAIGAAVNGIRRAGPGREQDRVGRRPGRRRRVQRARRGASTSGDRVGLVELVPVRKPGGEPGRQPLEKDRGAWKAACTRRRASVSRTSVGPAASQPARHEQPGTVEHFEDGRGAAFSPAREIATRIMPVKGFPPRRNVSARALLDRAEGQPGWGRTRRGMAWRIGSPEPW